MDSETLKVLRTIREDGDDEPLAAAFGILQLLHPIEIQRTRASIDRGSTRRARR